MKKLKIGITCYPVAGGSGIVATELGIKLAERGHQVHFIAYALPFRLDVYKPNLYFHEVETVSYQLFKYPPYTLTLAAKMAEISEAYELDLLHVHYAIPHASAAFLARQLTNNHSPKIITTLHGTDITLVGTDKSYYDITRFSIRMSDGITAVSDYLAKETIEEFKLEKHIEVIPNFIDVERFKPGSTSCCRKNFAETDEKLICHISNFRPVKRIMDVIEIFNRIQSVVPAKMLMIGEGPDTMLARRAVKKLGLVDKVRFLGNQAKVEEVLSNVDLFLCPSEEESFGLAALEALACGVPVIGSSGTGLVEVVEHGVNGFLCPVADTGAMAKAALSLLTGLCDLSLFKARAAEISHQKFNSKVVVDHYENYYHQVLEG
ncbi:MAG: N-acetyl-alpha-D-glucosaminyl L-malate synthase BshA [candidate division Zixibacteria bacterium]|nr:N-acetyl-alpha-D-glucosaminyl L-malate synthase BshA [candidate division Zixibacteria bacterium]